VRRQSVEQAADEALLDRALAGVQQLGQRHLESARDTAQQQHRRIAFTRFELREVALGDAGALCNGLARQAAPLACFADLLSIATRNCASSGAWRRTETGAR